MAKDEFDDLDDDISVSQGSPGAKIFALVIVVALAAVGYLAYSGKIDLFKVTEERHEIMAADVLANAKAGDARAVELLTAAALYEIRQMNFAPESEGAPTQIYLWDKWAVQEIEQLGTALEDIEDVNVLRGMERAYGQCVAAHGENHDRACVRKPVAYVSRHMTSILNKALDGGKMKQDEIVRILTAITKDEPLLLKSVAGSLNQFLRALDIVGNGRPDRYVVGETEPLKPELVQRLELVLALKLTPPAGTKDEKGACQFGQKTFDYPRECYGDRDIETAFSALSGRGRYSYWHLAGRVFGNARMMKALGKADAAKAYLESLGLSETVARAYGSEPKAFAGRGEQAVKDYNFKLGQLVDNVMKGGICAEIKSSKPVSKLPEDQSFVTTGGTTQSGKDTVRVTVVNKVELDMDLEEVPKVIGEISVIYYNQKNPKESFARKLEINEVATFNLPAGRYTTIFELPDVTLPGGSQSGFCNFTRGTIKPGAYLEAIAIGGPEEEDQATGASAGGKKK